MGQQTSEEIKQIDAEIISSIIPVEVNANPGTDSENPQNYAIFAGLTQKQTVVLTAMADNVMAENILSDAALSQKLGVSRDTIAKYRRDPKFSTALGLLVREIVKGNVDNVVGSIAQHTRKHWKAAEFLLKYIGAYTERTASLNIHANVDANIAFQSSGDAIDAFLIRLGELGWNSTRLATRFDELRREGAF